LSAYKSIEKTTINLTDISNVWPEYEGNLVFIQGYVKYPASPAVVDDFFGLSLETPLLRREVMMY
jgi:hypothetical protein